MEIKERQLEVFQEEKQVEKNHYYLSFAKENCTSMTIEQYFRNLDIEIRTVYPKNQLVLDDEKINQKLYSFSYTTKEQLHEEYLSILEKYGLYQDMEKVNQYGVVISKVEIVSTYHTLKQVLKQNPSLQYSYQLNGKYQ